MYKTVVSGTVLSLAKRKQLRINENKADEKIRQEISMTLVNLQKNTT